MGREGGKGGGRERGGGGGGGGGREKEREGGGERERERERERGKVVGERERERERVVATPHFRQLDEADKEASVFARDEDGRTALHHAARLGESHDIHNVHSGSPYNVHRGHMTYTM